MNHVRRIVSHTLLGVACSLALAPSLHSQPDDLAFQPADGKLPVTVVLAEGHGPPLILRRASEPRNVIVLNGTTSERQLSAAVFSLLIADAGDPGGQERSDNAALRATMPHVTPGYGNTAQVISRLRAARARRVGSLGNALRAIEIWVSPRRGHHQ